VLKARAVASARGIPLVPVHHMEAHALVARLTGSGVDPGMHYGTRCLARNVVFSSMSMGLNVLMVHSTESYRIGCMGNGDC